MTPKFVRNDSGYHSSGRTFKEKAHNFASFIKPLGWTGSWREDEETKDVTLIAERDNEHIEVYWNNPLPSPEVFYTYAGQRTKCRNISAAAKLAQEYPDPEKMRRASRKRRKAGDAASLYGSTGTGVDPTGETDSGDVIDELVTPLPWDHESTPEEIKKVLVKRSVTWVNRLTGAVQTATVKPKHLKITTTKAGKTVIEFADDYGFHAIYMDSIIGVG